MVVIQPTIDTCFAHLPIAGWPATWLHKIKSMVFQAHSHSFQRSKQTCQKSNRKSCQRVIVWSSPHALQQPHAFKVQQYNHVLYREKLATITQVALEEVTLLCSQHFSMFHITAQQSMCYMYSWNNVTRSHKSKSAVP